MSSRPLLEAHFDTAEDQLRREVSRLKEENSTLRAQVAEERTRADSAASGARALRRWLTGPYKAVGQILGEIDAFAGDGAAEFVSANPSKWEAWKKRLGGRESEFIDLLLLSPSMGITQLAAAAKCHYNTAQTTVKKLKDKGIVVESGGKYSLKDSA